MHTNATQEEVRWDYGRLRNAALQTYLGYCANCGVRYSANRVWVWNNAAAQWDDGVFTRPIENLMMIAIQMVMAFDEDEKSLAICRNGILRILRTNRLEDLLAQLPASEEEEFMKDFARLQIVGVDLPEKWRTWYAIQPDAGTRRRW